MDLQDLALALVIQSGGLHPWAHVSKGAEYDVPMRVDYRNAVEKWSKRPSNPQEETEIHGAGFKLQSDFTNRLPKGDFKQANLLANAIYKAAYASGITAAASKDMEYPTGDVGAMQKLSGNKNTRKLLGLDAALSAYQALNPSDKWSAGFDVIDGNPGFKVNMRW